MGLPIFPIPLLDWSYAIITVFIRLNAAAFINFRTYRYSVAAFIQGRSLFFWRINYYKNVQFIIIMALSKASKDETTRSVNCTRLKQNFKLLDKAVSLCDKAIHACRLQSVSSFLSCSDFTSVYMMSMNDICVVRGHRSMATLAIATSARRAVRLLEWTIATRTVLQPLRACVDPNISRGVYWRAVFISLRALEGAEFIRGQRLLKAVFNGINTVLSWIY